MNESTSDSPEIQADSVVTAWSDDQTEEDRPAESVAPELGRLSGMARLTRWLFGTAAVMLVGSSAYMLIGTATGLAFDGVDKPTSTVPVSISITSKQLLRDGCAGKADFAGLEKATLRYTVEGRDALNGVIGKGARSGGVCKFSVNFAGLDSQLFGPVRLIVTFPFADPIPFTFEVKKATPVVNVELSFD